MRLPDALLKLPRPVRELTLRALFRLGMAREYVRKQLRGVQL